jgi:hypothetical protein
VLAERRPQVQALGGLAFWRWRPTCSRPRLGVLALGVVGVVGMVAVS